MSVDVIQPYEPDRSMVGKLRRRLVRLYRRRPARGSRHSRPLLSLSFDDVPASAATVGADILRTHGLKAAYYISAGLIGQDGHMGPHVQWSDIERLHAEGHEIGCHTFDHTDLGQADADVSRRAVADNRAAFEAHGMPTPRTFAYPYGDVSFAPKTVLAPRFDLLRALHHGLVEGGTDLNQAPSVGLEGPNGEVTAIAWLRRAAQRKAWLILNGHDVQPNPSPWGCTPDTLRRVIDEALALGFEIVTVSEGVRRTA
jgi:peptidoglycan/xylan/chitin deacetylase (PgdA/CDA1 family)